MVLSGPHPSELVDVRITLSLRYFHPLPGGGVFCSVRALQLVRSEVRSTHQVSELCSS